MELIHEFLKKNNLPPDQKIINKYFNYNPNLDNLSLLNLYNIYEYQKEENHNELQKMLF